MNQTGSGFGAGFFMPEWKSGRDINQSMKKAPVLRENQGGNIGQMAKSRKKISNFCSYSVLKKISSAKSAKDCKIAFVQDILYNVTIKGTWYRPRFRAGLIYGFPIFFCILASHRYGQDV